VIYVFDLTVPANTPYTNPVTLDCEIDPGVVSQAEVIFPPGCAGLVRCAVFRELTQLWPHNPDSSFRGDGETIRWSEDYQVWEEPFVFVLKGWSDDDTYDHTITLRINVLRTQDTVGGARASGLPDYLRNVLISD